MSLEDLLRQHMDVDERAFYAANIKLDALDAKIDLLSVAVAELKTVNKIASWAAGMVAGGLISVAVALLVKVIGQ